MVDILDAHPLIAIIYLGPLIYLFLSARIHRSSICLLGLLYIYIILVPFYYVRIDKSTLYMVALVKYIPFLVISFFFFKGLFPKKSISFYSKISGDKVFLYIGCIFAFQLISLIGSSFPLDGFLKCVYYFFTGPILVYIVREYVRNEREMRWLLTTIILSLALSSLYGIYTFFIKTDPLYYQISLFYSDYLHITPDFIRPVFTLGNPTFAATLFVCVIPIGVAYYMTAETYYEKYIILFALVCITVGVIVSMTRIAYLALLSMFFLFPFIQRNKLIHREFFLLVPIIGMICLCLVWLNPETAQNASQFSMNRITSMFDHNISDMNRIHLWRIAALMFSDSPVTGIGFGQYSQIMLGYLDSVTGNIGRVQVADNMYLTTIVEVGIVGSVPVILFLRYIFKNIRILLNESAQNRDERAILSAYTCSLAAFFICMATWDVLNQPTNRIMFWTMIGLLQVKYRSTVDS